LWRKKQFGGRRKGGGKGGSLKRYVGGRESNSRKTGVPLVFKGATFMGGTAQRYVAKHVRSTGEAGEGEVFLRLRGGKTGEVKRVGGVREANQAPTSGAKHDNKRL